VISRGTEDSYVVRKISFAFNKHTPLMPLNQLKESIIDTPYDCLKDVIYAITDYSREIKDHSIYIRVSDGAKRRFEKKMKPENILSQIDQTLHIIERFFDNGSLKGLIEETKKVKKRCF